MLRVWALEASTLVVGIRRLKRGPVFRHDSIRTILGPTMDSLVTFAMLLLTDR
jgi:hypothetical protein